LINSDSFNSTGQDESQVNTIGHKVMQLIADGYLDGKRDTVFYLAQCGYDFTKAKGLKKQRAKALSTQEYYALKRDYAQGGLNIYEEIKEKSTFLRLLSGIRHFYVEQEKHGEGVEYLERSRQAVEGIGVRSDIVMALADQGDAYMAASGLGVQSAEEARKAAVNMVKFALDMQAYMIVRKEELEANNEAGFKMCAGIHTGPVIAGVVGNKKFQHDIWGKTVKTASQTESSGYVGKVNISQTTFDLLKGEHDFAFESRGKGDVKGKGEIEMYFVAVLREKENWGT
jgi:hypothetical protein